MSLWVAGSALTWERDLASVLMWAKGLMSAMGLMSVWAIVQGLAVTPAMCQG
jgi:hypothetical protein